jgi:hypothetical protein
MSVRFSSALRTAASVLTGGRPVGRYDPRRPRRRVVLREDRLLQVVLGLGEVVLGEDDALLAARELGLRLHHVERRHGADLHADLVLLQEPLGEIEVLLRRRERVDGVDQLVVVDLHLRHGREDGLAELHVADLAVLLGDPQLVARGVDSEVAEQRLVEADVELRAVVRVQRGERVVRVALEVVEVDRERAARLLQRDLGAEVPHVLLRVHDVAAREGARALGVGRGAVEGRVEHRVERALRAEDVLLAQLGVVARDREVRVVLESPLDGLVERQAELAAGGHRLRRGRLSRLLLCGSGRRVLGRGRRGREAGDGDGDEQRERSPNPSSHVVRDLQAA